MGALREVARDNIIRVSFLKLSSKTTPSPSANNGRPPPLWRLWNDPLQCVQWKCILCSDIGYSYFKVKHPHYLYSFWGNAPILYLLLGLFHFRSWMRGGWNGEKKYGRGRFGTKIKRCRGYGPQKIWRGARQKKLKMAGGLAKFSVPPLRN